MGEAKQPRRLPWGMLVALILLGALTVGAHGYWAQPPAQASPLSALVVSGIVLFIVGRHLLNYTWGFLLAAAFILHPTVFHLATLENNPLAVEIWPLAALLSLIFLWECLFAVEISILSILGTGVVLVLLGSLAWLVRPRVGLEVALLSLLGLLVPAVLAERRRQRKEESLRPHLGNILTGYTLAPVVPLAGLLLVPLLAQGLWWLQEQIRPVLHWPGPNLLPILATPPAGELDPLAPLRAVWHPDPRNWIPSGFASEELEQWTWPQPLVVLILIGYGLWRAYYTGRRYWPTRHLPLTWLLLVYAFVVLVGVLLNPTGLSTARFYPLTILAVLLGIFGVGDYLREVGQRLVLPPPGEVKLE